MSSAPNPQGKGLVTVFENLEQSKTRIAVKPKYINQVSDELFTSLFILHSNFSFKPVIGKQYWLYYRDNHFHLSLIAPDEWGDNNYGYFIGNCIMQDDITWSLELEPGTYDNKEILDIIENRKIQFHETLKHAVTINEALPYYLEGLPFYQRVYASAVACSLRDSLDKTGSLQLNHHQAKQLALSASEL